MKKMLIEKEDLINKFETMSSYVRLLGNKSLDSKYYNQLCDEVDEFIEELRTKFITIDN